MSIFKPPFAFKDQTFCVPRALRTFIRPGGGGGYPNKTSVSYRLPWLEFYGISSLSSGMMKCCLGRDHEFSIPQYPHTKCRDWTAWVWAREVQFWYKYSGSTQREWWFLFKCCGNTAAARPTRTCSSYDSQIPKVLQHANIVCLYMQCPMWRQVKNSHRNVIK